MSSLSNAFGFSFSSWKTLRACPRRWWISKVLFWEGWERNAPRLARLAYALTKMQTVWTFAGSLVHRFAQEAVENLPARTVEQALSAFESAYDAGVAESRAGAWKKAPKKHVNLFEHYYRLQDADRLVEMGKRNGAKAILGLFASESLARARRGRVVQFELLETMRIAGIPVWVQIDLVVEEGGIFYLTDWKSGKEKGEDRVQAILYALYWHEVRRVPLEKIRLVLSYLGAGVERIFEVTEDDLDELRAAIVTAAAEVLDLLDPNDPPLNAAPAARFEPILAPDVCSRCEQLHACALVAAEEGRAWTLPVELTPTELRALSAAGETGAAGA